MPAKKTTTTKTKKTSTTKTAKAEKATAVTAQAKKETSAVKAKTSKSAEAKEPKKETVTKKATTKKSTAKKAATKKSTTAKKTTAKKTTKKTAAKKTAAKKASAAKSTKATKSAAKEAPSKKAAEKKTAPVKEEKAEKAETAAVKEEVKDTKAAVMEEKAVKEEKAVNKKEEAAEKAAAVEKINQEKLDSYNNFALDTCIEMAKAMGVDLDYDQYANMLLDNADVKALADHVLADFDVDKKAFTFNEDGYDTDLIEVIFNRVGETTDIKASDFEDIENDIKKHTAYIVKDDSTANNEEYKADFDLVRKILMIAQRKDIHNTEDMKPLIHVNPSDMIDKFMDLAYDVLPLFEYDDVKYYENFIYAVLSQFDDLHEKWGTRAMMDVADLYIKHGDYGLGDADYNYVLRENQIKDYIYYRFAKVYYDNIDRDKAKAIANSALQYVDDRFTYYKNIIDILEN